jgi:hypothetical protein
MKIIMTLDKPSLREPFRYLLSVNGVAGGASGFVTCLLLQPLDVVKTRLQQPRSFGSGNHRDTIDIAKYILHEKGIRGLWRGTMPTIYRVVPGSMLYFSLLGTIQSYILTTQGKTHLSVYENLCAGGIIRAILGIILLPLSVLKARYEVSDCFYLVRNKKKFFFSSQRVANITIITM